MVNLKNLLVILGIFVDCFLLVLLCPENCVWKIIDFGLTSRGTPKTTYSTDCASGTRGYRAPELVRETSIFTMQSDIFSLGCILHELVFGARLFDGDWGIFDYSRTRQRQANSDIGIDYRMEACTTKLIDAMLEVNWWERPFAHHILETIDAILKHVPPFVVGDRPWKSSVEREAIQQSCDKGLSDHNNNLWKDIRWRPFWYILPLPHSRS